MFTENHRIKLRALCRDFRDRRLSPLYNRIFYFLSTPYADQPGGQVWYQGFCKILEEIQNFIEFHRSQEHEVDIAMLDSWYQWRLAKLGIKETLGSHHTMLEWIEETRDKPGNIFLKHDPVYKVYLALKESQLDPRLASKSLIEDIVGQMSKIHIEICEFYSQLRKELLIT